jgi:hypothetical protein
VPRAVVKVTNLLLATLNAHTVVYFVALLSRVKILSYGLEVLAVLFVQLNYFLFSCLKGRYRISMQIWLPEIFEIKKFYFTQYHLHLKWNAEIRQTKIVTKWKDSVQDPGQIHIF